MDYQNLVVVFHLIITLLLIGAVLIQRSEGGALGIGGGGGGGLMSGRTAATTIQKTTWGLAIAFAATSLLLALLGSDQGGIDTSAGEQPPAPQVQIETPTEPVDEFSIAPSIDDGFGAPAAGQDGATPQEGAGQSGADQGSAEGEGASVAPVETDANGSDAAPVEPAAATGDGAAPDTPPSSPPAGEAGGSQ